MNEAATISHQPMTDADATRIYRRVVESAAAGGGIDSVPASDVDPLRRAIEHLGLTRETVVGDVGMWRGHLAALASAKSARSAVDALRSVADVDAHLEREKDALELKLAEIVQPIRAIVLERHERERAETRAVHAERQAVTPTGLSWAFHSLARPDAGRNQAKRIVFEGPERASGAEQA